VQRNHSDHGQLACTGDVALAAGADVAPLVGEARTIGEGEAFPRR